MIEKLFLFAQKLRSKMHRSRWHAIHPARLWGVGRSLQTSPLQIPLAQVKALALAVLLILTACTPPPPPVPKVVAQVAVGGSGSGTITSDTGEVNCATVCSASVTKDAPLNFTATADTGSTFVGWGGACLGTSCPLTPSSNVTIIAYFRRNTKMVATGGYHSCVLRPTGAVLCWGRNSDGQIGNGTVTPTAFVSPVTGLTNAVQIAAGGYHTCALLVGGMVQCWGNNNEGQLGTGNKINTSAPVFVSGISDAVAITTGAFHSCARRANWLVMCWGLNADGQFGDDTTNSSSTPQLVRIDALSISAGGFHTCFMLPNSSVKCRGRNADGQLGLGAPASGNMVKKSDGTELIVKSIAGAIGVGQFGAALLGGYHTCAIGIDTDLYCWGNNNEKQTSSGASDSAPIPFATAQQNLAHGAYLMVAAGAYHTCALRYDGIYCQGHYGDGELGDGTFNHRTAGPLIGTAGAFHLAAGGFHTCAVLNTTPTGTVACWGNNGDGQVTGRPTSTNFGSPTIIPAPFSP